MVAGTGLGGGECADEEGQWDGSAEGRTPGKRERSQEKRILVRKFYLNGQKVPLLL